MLPSRDLDLIEDILWMQVEEVLQRSRIEKAQPLVAERRRLSQLHQELDGASIPAHHGEVHTPACPLQRVVF